MFFAAPGGAGMAAGVPGDSPTCFTQQEHHMKKLALIALLATLTGCASGPDGLTESNLRQSVYHRQERIVAATFPQLQMALFRQEQACGSAPTFKMNTRQTNFATLIDLPDPSSPYELAVMADLTQFMETHLAPARIRAEIYSYYSDSATLDRINRLFDAIEYPGVCPGEARVRAPKSDEAKPQ